MATALVWQLNLDAEVELADPKHYAPIPHSASASARSPAHAHAAGWRRLRAGCVGRRTASCARGAHGARVLSHAERPRAHPKRGTATAARTARRAARAREQPRVLGSARSDAAACVLRPRHGGTRGSRPRALPHNAFVTSDRLRSQDASADKRVPVCSTPRHGASACARSDGARACRSSRGSKRRGDFAQHGFVTASGRLLTGPLVAQRNDDSGRWLSSELSPPAACRSRKRAPLERSVHEAGQALRRRGLLRALRHRRLSLPRCGRQAGFPGALEGDQRALHHGLPAQPARSRPRTRTAAGRRRCASVTQLCPARGASIFAGVQRVGDFCAPAVV